MSAYVGSSKNLKDLKGERDPRRCFLRQGFYWDGGYHMCQENLRIVDSNEARDGGARMEARSLGAFIPKRLSASQGVEE